MNGWNLNINGHWRRNSEHSLSHRASPAGRWSWSACISWRNPRLWPLKMLRWDKQVMEIIRYNTCMQWTKANKYDVNPILISWDSKRICIKTKVLTLLSLGGFLGDHVNCKLYGHVHVEQSEVNLKWISIALWTKHNCLEITHFYFYSFSLYINVSKK